MPVWLSNDYSAMAKSNWNALCASLEPMQQIKPFNYTPVARDTRPPKKDQPGLALARNSDHPVLLPACPRSLRSLRAAGVINESSFGVALCTLSGKGLCGLRSDWLVVGFFQRRVAIFVNCQIVCAEDSLLCSTLLYCCCRIKSHIKQYAATHTPSIE